MAFEDEFKLVQVAVGTISPGDQLAVLKPIGTVLFNVHRVKVNHTPPAPLIYELTSEPVGDTPWVLTFKASEVVQKVVPR
ncbi:hypothetical protein O4215_20560 [Rhodococcus maanshanensis]|uniref:hypothetical protein n=1 Tax=Rhodococcus maanshanensis TaxID=183556 RepID=UPI0022B55849|nr:hypothetical protein [Rhodococcus maanshanensis]MCZ4557957.1 hypothetical protein [Rhodococcus maanshanensis]